VWVTFSFKKGYKCDHNCNFKENQILNTIWSIQTVQFHAAWRKWWGTFLEPSCLAQTQSHPCQLRLQFLTDVPPGLPTNNNDTNTQIVPRYYSPTICIMLCASHMRLTFTPVTSWMVHNGYVKGSLVLLPWYKLKFLTGDIQGACREFLDGPCSLHTKQCPSPWVMSNDWRLRILFRWKTWNDTQLSETIMSDNFLKNAFHCRKNYLSSGWITLVVPGGILIISTVFWSSSWKTEV
jgi:hypothetical protein